MLQDFIQQEDMTMVRKDNVLEVEHLGGGKGTAYVHHIVSKEELLGTRQNVRKGSSSLQVQV